MYWLEQIQLLADLVIIGEVDTGKDQHYFLSLVIYQMLEHVQIHKLQSKYTKMIKVNVTLFQHFLFWSNCKLLILQQINHTLHINKSRPFLTLSNTFHESDINYFIVLGTLVLAFSFIYETSSTSLESNPILQWGWEWKSTRFVLFTQMK